MITAILKAVGRSIAGWIDPVCQDKDAAMFGEHAGMVVRLVPVVEPNGHVKAWIPDPDEAAMAERLAAQQPASAPPALPPALPPAPQPAFNPAGVPGI